MTIEPDFPDAEEDSEDNPQVKDSEHSRDSAFLPDEDIEKGDQSVRKRRWLSAYSYKDNYGAYQT